MRYIDWIALAFRMRNLVKDILFKLDAHFKFEDNVQVVNVQVKTANIVCGFKLNDKAEVVSVLLIDMAFFDSFKLGDKVDIYSVVNNILNINDGYHLDLAKSGLYSVTTHDATIFDDFKLNENISPETITQHLVTTDDTFDLQTIVNMDCGPLVNWGLIANFKLNDYFEASIVQFNDMSIDESFDITATMECDNIIYNDAIVDDTFDLNTIFDINSVLLYTSKIEGNFELKEDVTVHVYTDSFLYDVLPYDLSYSLSLDLDSFLTKTKSEE